MIGGVETGVGSAVEGFGGWWGGGGVDGLCFHVVWGKGRSWS